MDTIRTIAGVLLGGLLVGIGWVESLAAPPEPIQAGQKLFTMSPAPLQVSTETLAVVGPGVELVAEQVQDQWVWVTVRGWVRSGLVQLPVGGLLQSGQTLVTRSEAPLQVETETRAVVLPGRKVRFEQAQGDWLWVAVEGWCQAQYLTKEPPTVWQAPPPAADTGWQYQQPSQSYYYYYYYYDSSPYRYPSYWYYYDRYWPGYYRYRYWPGYYPYWPRTWIDIDIDIYRYWPPERYRPPYPRPDRPDARPDLPPHRPPYPKPDRPPYPKPDHPPHRPGGPGDRPDGPPHRPPDEHRPPEGHRPPDRPPYPKPDRPPQRPDSPPLRPPDKPDAGPKLPPKLEPGPKTPGKPDVGPIAPPKWEPGPKLPKVGPRLPKVSLDQPSPLPGGRQDRPTIKNPPSVRQDRPAIKAPGGNVHPPETNLRPDTPSSSARLGRPKEFR
ncbi:MAG: hypothetical protein NZ602_01035 [Thermoguttaceae bacterium]|nr:hypothetical protein [Thermoguttaceae bacterium]MDW8037995.1 hypothetical protein [Thermoguttaceae bacterium]